MRPQDFVEEAGDKPLKCAYCDYRCRAKTALGRHIYLHHPEVRGLTKINLTREDATDLATALSGWMQQGDRVIPKRLLIRLKRHDLKLQAALRVLAVDKVLRLAGLSQLIEQVDNRLRKLLLDRGELDRMKPGRVMQLQQRLEGAISNDLRFVKEILSLKDEGGSNLVERIATVFGAVKVDSDGSFHVQKGIAAQLPQDPAEREELRRLVTAFLSVRDDVGLLEGKADVREPESASSDRAGNN